jgi:hypothetical protein
MSATTTLPTSMKLAGQYRAFLMDRKIMELTASSCNGRDVASRGGHYKISQIVITQLTDFRWKVAIFTPPSPEYPQGRCIESAPFNNHDKMLLWLSDVSRLHTWAQIEGVGLEKEAAA